MVLDFKASYPSSPHGILNSPDLMLMRSSQLGSETFVGKSVYIEGEEHAPAIPSLQDLLIFHDCQYITWYWLANGIGTGAQEVKGINIFTVSSDCKQIVQDHLEFNSIAWGIDDQQVTNTPPPPPGRR